MLFISKVYLGRLIFPVADTSTEGTPNLNCVILAIPSFMSVLTSSCLKAVSPPNNQDTTQPTKQINPAKDLESQVKKGLKGLFK